MTPRLARPVAALLGIAALGLAVAACAPEPEATSSPSASATTTATATSTATPTATATSSADDIALPDSCEQIYSASMLQSLQASEPLNDPGITMYATNVVPALEILESGIPTLRCTWGAPSEQGLATQVSIVDAHQSATILDALAANGFSCEDLDSGTVCRIQSQTVDLNDDLVTQGETQYLRGNAWVTTSWIDLTPDGYTEDIVATLWK